jgi:hypothetical protein
LYAHQQALFLQVPSVRVNMPVHPCDFVREGIIWCIVMSGSAGK